MAQASFRCDSGHAHADRCDALLCNNLRLAAANSALMAAIDRLPAWLSERGCDLLLPTDDPADSERPPFLEAAISAARPHEVP